MDTPRSNDELTLREIRVRVPWPTLEALGLEEFATLLRECSDTVRLQSVACRGSSGTLMLEVDEPIEPSPIASLGYVETFELVGHGPSRYEYLLRLEIPRCRSTLEEEEGEFFVDGPIQTDEEGMTFTAVASQTALGRFDEAFDGMGSFLSNCDVLHVGPYSGGGDRLDPLTERQQQILTTAFERDYFEVPRGVTAEDLADEFDLDKSTVLEHLRRAEKNLLAGILEETGGIPLR